MIRQYEEYKNLITVLINTKDENGMTPLMFGNH